MKTSSLLQEKKDKSHNLVLKLNNQIFCLSREDLKKQVKTKPFYVIQTSEGTYNNRARDGLPEYIRTAQNEDTAKVLKLEDMSLDRSFISFLNTNQKIFELYNPRKALLFLNKNQKDIKTTLYSVRPVSTEKIFEQSVREKEFIEGKKRLWEQQNPLSKVCGREEMNYDIISGKQINYDNELILLFIRNKNESDKNKDKIVYCYTLTEMRSMLHKNVDFSKKELTEIDGKILTKLLFWNIYVDATALSRLINSGINTIELIEHKSEKVTWHEPVASSRQVVLPKSKLESVFIPGNQLSQTYHDVGEYRYRKMVSYYYDESLENPTNKIHEIIWYKYRIDKPDEKVISSYNDEPAYVKRENNTNNFLEEEKWMLDGKLHREPKNKDESDWKYPAYIKYIKPDDPNLLDIFDNSPGMRFVPFDDSFDNFSNNPFGNIKSVESQWFRNGILYRKNSNDPVLELVIPSRGEIQEIFFQENQIVEKFYKATFYDKRGFIDWNKPKLYKEEWYKNGKLHREGKLPAYIEYDKNGNIINQKWYIEGVFHGTW